MHGERHHRRVAGLGIWSSSWSRCGGRALTKMRMWRHSRREQRENLGLALRMKVFDVLGHRFRQDGKGVQGTEKTLAEKYWAVGGVMGTSIARRVCPLNTKCHKVVSDAFSTALNGSANWSWNVARSTNTRHWRSKIL